MYTGGVLAPPEDAGPDSFGAEDAGAEADDSLGAVEYAGGADAGADSLGAEADEDWPDPPAPPLPAHLPPDDSFTS